MILKRIALSLALSAALVSSQGCSVLGIGKTPTPLPQQRADDLFKEGEDLLAKGSYEEARKKYTTIRERDPEKTYDALVQVRLGDSYYEEARYAEAEVEYKRFLELHPHNKAAPYVMYQIGMCNFKQIDTTDRDPSFAVAAMAQFSKLLKEYPTNPYKEEAAEKLKVAMTNVAGHEFTVGKYYYKQGAYKAAAKRFKGIIENYRKGADEPEVLYWLADSQIRSGEMDSAKETLSILYQEYPTEKFSVKAKEHLAGRIKEK